MHSEVSLAGALGHEMSDRRVAILREIGQCGSISQAARTVGVSYKAAWQAVDTLTNLAGVPLVSRVVGGAGGGGASLTAAGHELLAAADAMAKATGEVLSRWQTQPHAGAGLARLAVRTSMRNQLPCKVLKLEEQGQIVRVHMALQLPAQPISRDALEKSHVPLDAPARSVLVARITRESAELLGLATGISVQTLCKATAVQVERATRLPGAKSQPNAQAAAHSPSACILRGKAVRVVRGALGDEVSAELLDATRPGGLNMVGFAAPDSGLRAGSAVVLSIDENALVLALSSA